MRAVLTALGLPLLPLAACGVALHPRLRPQLAERLGWRVASVQPGSVWVHAASVGEVRVVEALLPDLPRPVLVTTDTDTGRETARRLAHDHPEVYASACPVDHDWSLAPLWAEARPRLVAFVEGTFWPALAWRARAAGVPVWRVAAKASRRTRRVPRAVLRALWTPTDVVWARDPEQAAYLSSVHEDVRILGNPKRWGRPPSGGLQYPRPTVVGVSTRPGDEARLLDAAGSLAEPPLVVLAPRHLERVEAVAIEVARRGLPMLRRSEAGTQVPSEVSVVLVDTHGDLPADLVGAAAALIGGTFDPSVGGHAPWEAAKAGVPVLAGPWGHSQGPAFDEVGAFRVTEASLAETLASVLARPRPACPPTSGPPEAWSEALRRVGGPAAEAPPRPWARPLTPAWALGAAILRSTRRPVQVDVPVIGVGSVNARGPGRTSLTRALARELVQRGHTVGVALRGYRRRDRRPFVGGDPADVDRLGDEGAVHALAGALVAADPDRRRGVRALVARGATVVLLDDGLLRGDVRMDQRIAVIDARFPGARGRLPAGERRPGDPAPTCLVATHVGRGWPLPPGAWPLERRPGPWMQGDGPAAPPTRPVLAFAGIARPVDFFDSLEIPVAERVALPDHAPIDAALFARLRASGRPLVTTGKDAVRLARSWRAEVWWRELDVVLPAAVLSELPEAPR